MVEKQDQTKYEGEEADLFCTETNKVGPELQQPGKKSGSQTHHKERQILKVTDLFASGEVR